MATKLVDKVAQRLGQSAASSGYFPTITMIVNALNDGAKEVAHSLIPYAIPEHIKEYGQVATATSGLSIPSDFIKEVQIYQTTNYTNVRRVPAYLRHLLKDSSSMHCAKSSDWAYYFKNNNIFIEPASAASGINFNIVYVGIPPSCSIGTLENYASWNDNIEELAIDYGVIRGKESQIGDLTERFKTALTTAKQRAVSAVSTIGGYNFSISKIASCVSSLDSLLPPTSELSVSNLAQTISISSVSFSTAPSISTAGIPTLADMVWSETRILNVLNAASRAVSIVTTQITSEDFEKGQQYLLQADKYLQQAVDEINNERGNIESYNAQINKALGQYQTEVNKYLQYFNSKLERAVQQSNFDKNKYDSKHQYSIQYWQAKVTRAIEKINAQLNKYQVWFNEETNKNRMILEKANARLQTAIAEMQIAGAYIQNNATIFNEIKMLEDRFEKRIAIINARYTRSG